MGIGDKEVGASR